MPMPMDPSERYRSFQPSATWKQASRKRNYACAPTAVSVPMRTPRQAVIDYYTQYIKRHAEWQFVKVYTDEGISGTNMKKRDGFNQMIQDALDGKILRQGTTASDTGPVVQYIQSELYK